MAFYTFKTCQHNRKGSYLDLYRTNRYRVIYFEIWIKFIIQEESFLWRLPQFWFNFLHFFLFFPAIFWIIFTPAIISAGYSGPVNLCKSDPTLLLMSSVTNRAYDYVNSTLSHTTHTRREIYPLAINIHPERNSAHTQREIENTLRDRRRFSTHWKRDSVHTEREIQHALKEGFCTHRKRDSTHTERERDSAHTKRDILHTLIQRVNPHWERDLTQTTREILHPQKERFNLHRERERFCTH